jgi:hypothetical protein
MRLITINSGLKFQLWYPQFDQELSPEYLPISSTLGPRPEKVFNNPVYLSICAEQGG